MSESPAIRCAVPRARAEALDARRKLQLALGALWLLDGILQFQPSMFTKAFPGMLAGTSAGNPAFVASPVSWSAALITHHLVVLNAVFAAIQVALGLGIAWRPTVRLALAASVLWSLAVWFLGEGLGGVLAGTASLTDGAPGAVILSSPPPEPGSPGSSSAPGAAPGPARTVDTGSLVEGRTMAVTTELAGNTQVELVIGGMTCAACAARVQAKLNKVTGVTASVNLSTERAYVSAPPAVSADTLIGVVEATGYTAEIARPAEPEATAADSAETAEDAAVRRLRRRLTLALVFFVPLTDLSMMLSIFPWTRFAGWQPLLVALAAPVAIWAAWPFHAAALRQARHLSSSMDTLVSLGILAACGWSVYAMFALDRGKTGPSGLDSLLHGGAGGGIYLEVAASVTTFLLAGRLYEARARRTAGRAIRELAAAGARDVCVLAEDGTEQRLPADRLQPGQRFVVRPGERIAADGEVLAGQSAIDRSAMTGESIPADAAPGDPVTGGTIVLTGRLVVRAERVGADTQLAHMLRLVEQAQAGKAGIQRLADRVCAVFVPSVLACSALTLAGWLAAGSAAGHAVSAALAVLIIACPCALGLATPAALIVASGRGARMGIFIKGYQALESSRAIDTVVLDKTGTVTTGQLTVTAVRIRTGVARPDLLRYAGSVEQASEHAVAAAITALARSELVSLTLAEDFIALPGLGARGVVDGREVIVGRTRLFADRETAVPADLAAWCRAQEEAGNTTVLAAWDGEIRGAFAVTDTVKPSAAAAVARLRALGLRPVLLTGDNAATAQAVGAAVGVDEIRGEALPAAKAQVITELENQGRSVAMAGDGVNDGPALAAARLGLALGSGTDVAIAAADMILLRDDLGAVPDAIALARAAFRTIRANLAWAFCYNVLAIPLAALGLANPLVAAATMTLSSVFVVWNSLRLRRFNPGS
jgi:Cu+-exporting ATPase